MATKTGVTSTAGCPLTRTMTHSEKINQRQSEGPTDLSAGSLPREKESVMTVVPCTLGKVRNWYTVDDSVRSHMNQKKGNKEFTGFC